MTIEEITTLVVSAYEKNMTEFKTKECDYPADFRLMDEEAMTKALKKIKKYDLSRQVVDIVPLCDGKMLVIDEPRNYADAFAYNSGAMYGNRGAKTAVLMREWFHVKVLHLDLPGHEGMFLETVTRCRLNKDMAKATKKLEKEKKSFIESQERRAKLGFEPIVHHTIKI